MLGAFMIAGDRFKDPFPTSMILYNISHGMPITNFSPWFARFVRSQDFEDVRSHVELSVTMPGPWRVEAFVASLLATAACSLLIIGAILMQDWWGIANAIALTASIPVRAFLLYETKKAIDDRIQKATEAYGTGPPAKCLLITENAKALTIVCPSTLLLPPSPLISDIPITDPNTYGFIRGIGWLAFGIHIIAIGMSALICQLYTVVLLVLPTFLYTAWKVGCNDSKVMTTVLGRSRRMETHLLAPFGQKSLQAGDEWQHQPSPGDHDFVGKWQCNISSRLRISCREWPVAYALSEIKDGRHTFWVSGRLQAGHERSRKRQDLYAWLALMRDEKESMDKWDLFPHIRNENSTWWQTYQLKKHARRGNLEVRPQPDYWDSQMPNREPKHSPWAKLNRVATTTFSSQSPASSDCPLSSSAFPALSTEDNQDEEGSDGIVSRQISTEKAG